MAAQAQLVTALEVQNSLLLKTQTIPESYADIFGHM